MNSFKLSLLVCIFLCTLIAAKFVVGCLILIYSSLNVWDYRKDTSTPEY